MFDRNLIPKTDLETAEVNVKSADAQIRSSEASLVQAKASLNNQKVNLDHTVITAPIDGIVIARNVDQGQTVAASMNAPIAVRPRRRPHQDAGAGQHRRSGRGPDAARART